MINFRGDNIDRLVAEKEGVMLELHDLRAVLIKDKATSAVLGVVSFDGLTAIPEDACR